MWTEVVLRRVSSVVAAGDEPRAQRSAPAGFEEPPRVAQAAVQRIRCARTLPRVVQLAARRGRRARTVHAVGTRGCSPAARASASSRARDLGLLGHQESEETSPRPPLRAPPPAAALAKSSSAPAHSRARDSDRCNALGVLAFSHGLALTPFCAAPIRVQCF